MATDERMTVTGAVEIPTAKPAPATRKTLPAFVHMRIDRALEEAALLAVEFCEDDGLREWFTGAADRAFERIQAKHHAYNLANGTEVLSETWSWVVSAVAGGLVAQENPDNTDDPGLPRGTREPRR